jgi:hypothetical protein
MKKEGTRLEMDLKTFLIEVLMIPEEELVLETEPAFIFTLEEDELLE